MAASKKTIIKKIIVGKPIKNVDPTSVGNASQLASNPPSYYLDYTNFTNTPAIESAGDVTDVIDSAYIAARASAFDSADAIALIDSAYVQARQVDLQRDSGFVTGIIDSAYVVARSTPLANLRDSDSDIVITGDLLPSTDSSFDIGSPTRKFKDLYLSGSTLYIGGVAIGTDSNNNVKIFTLDANGQIDVTQGKVALVDSSEPTEDVRTIVDSSYVSLRVDRSLFLDSDEVIALVDSSYVAARTFTQSQIEDFARGVSLDSASTLALVDSTYVKGFIDSAYIQARVNLRDSAFVTGIVDSAYIQARDRFRDSAFITGIVDSAYIRARDRLRDSNFVEQIVDSAYIQLRDRFQEDSTFVTNIVDNTYVKNIIDSAYRTELIDSAYIQARQVDLQRDSAFVTGIIDSAYIQARDRFRDSAFITGIVDSAYITARDRQRDSSFITTIVDSAYITARASTFDSDNAIGLIDSAYIVARAGDAGIDSAEAIALIDSAYVQARVTLRDSAFITGIVDSAYIIARDRQRDSAFVTGIIDSGYITARTFTQSEIEDFARGVSLDSAEAELLIDSAYVLLHGLQNIKDSGSDVVVSGGIMPDPNVTGQDIGSPTNRFRSLYVGGATLYVGDLALSDAGGGTLRISAINSDGSVDSAIAAKDVSFVDSSLILQMVQPNIDSAVDSAILALIDGAPGALDTLNELAAALNDDSDAYNTLLSTINSLPDSAQVQGLIDSAYIQARQTTNSTDSSTITSIVDSDYISARQSATNLTLNPVSDSSLTDGAIQTFTSNTSIVDAIDDLNEALENVRNNTFVKSVTFTGTPLAGGEGLTVTLSVVQTGQANRYDVYWGDGNVDSNITSTSPSHTYNSNTNSPFNVRVRAFNNSATGTGSEANLTRTDYVTIYTADPVAGFAAYAAPTGGSPITFWNDGDTVYFQNNTTNTTMADVTYKWTWGDGDSDRVDSDNAAGGVTGDRISHTFAAATETDVQRTTELEILTHTTADPTVIDNPVQTSDTFEIYDSHTPSFTHTGNTYGINTTGGMTRTFTNTTEAGFGSYSTYNNQYKWTWGDGDSDVINAGSGAAGDRSVAINHTFQLVDSDQENGHIRTFTTNLQGITRHTSSPFSASSVTFKAIPEVRAIIDSADTHNRYISFIPDDANIYNYFGYNGRKAYEAVMQHNSQNHDSDGVVSIVWGDGTTDTDLASGTDHTHEFDLSSFTAPTTISSSLRVSGTISGDTDIGLQNDSSKFNWSYASNPDDTIQLDSATWTISSSTDGTSPRLCHSHTNNSGFSDPSFSQGLSLSGTDVVRFSGTSGDKNTNSSAPFSLGHSGRCELYVNSTKIDQINAGRYSTSFVVPNYTSESANTGFARTGASNFLLGTSDRDQYYYNSSYPSGFSRMGTIKAANIGAAELENGFNRVYAYYNPAGDFGQSSYNAMSLTAKTSKYLYYILDTVSATPGIVTSGGINVWNLSDSATTSKYIGGVPYFSSGTIIILQGKLTFITGECYTDQTNIVEVDRIGNWNDPMPGTDTVGIGFPDQNYSYADILDSSDITLNFSNTRHGTLDVPHANLGRTSNYDINDLTFSVPSGVISIENGYKIRARNVNGVSSYTNKTKRLRVHSKAKEGIDEMNISVADALGAGFDDDGKRIQSFVSTDSDTPAFTASTNFYTTSSELWSDTSAISGLAGSQEAGQSPRGVIRHDTNDYSTDFIPIGPDRSSDTGTQYFTFAFRRTLVNSFDVNITSGGIKSFHVALPGDTAISFTDTNNWLDASKTFGDDNGCANTNGDQIGADTSLSGSFSMQLGTGNSSNSTGNVILIRIGIGSGQSITALSIS